MTRIPIARPLLGDTEQDAVAEVLRSGWITQGPRVEAFEKAVAARVGAREAVAVSSCTAALHLALVVAGVGPGDEVICPSLSFVATANAIVHAGARPVFAEVDPATWCLDPADVETRITERTRAVMPVHQVGMPADLDGLGAVCGRHGLQLIEDAACALGSEYHGRPVGAGAYLACFSFHPRKILTTGEGGMIVTSSSELASRLRRLRHHGMSIDDRVRHEANTPLEEDYLERGWNYRMSDLHAAVGLAQLERLGGILDARRQIVARYRRALAGLPAMLAPFEPPGRRTNHQSLGLTLLPDAPISRDALMARLLDAGIATRRGIMTIHRASAYRDAVGDLRLPHSEEVSDRSLLLPLFVPMNGETVDRVCAELRCALSGCRQLER